jgi:hypothetical protein
MKKFIVAILSLLLACHSHPMFANEEISDNAKNADALYREGSGAVDGAYTATSVSMLGWGIGLAAGIAILAAALHQSKASTAH